MNCIDIGFDQMLAMLHQLHGRDFIRCLQLITERHEFTPIPNNPNIYAVGGEQNKDFGNLLSAAQRAVDFGNTVFVLPNPKRFRTADLIFVRKGIYKMYDLKTISGKSSVDNRLIDSIGQSNRVLLNIKSDYNPIALARSIRMFFEKNPQAIEVLIYKRHKAISTIREDALNKSFFKLFVAKYVK